MEMSQLLQFAWLGSFKNLSLHCVNSQKLIKFEHLESWKMSFRALYVAKNKNLYALEISKLWYYSSCSFYLYLTTLRLRTFSNASLDSPFMAWSPLIGFLSASIYYHVALLRIAFCLAFPRVNMKNWHVN